MTTTEQILTLAGALGVSGGEDGAVEAARQMLAPLGACERAPLGSLLSEKGADPAFACTARACGSVDETASA